MTDNEEIRKDIVFTRGHDTSEESRLKARIATLEAENARLRSELAAIVEAADFAGLIGSEGRWWVMGREDEPGYNRKIDAVYDLLRIVPTTPSGRTEHYP
jgi:hypothetical protein